jgi:hypothetical protein
MTMRICGQEFTTTLLDRIQLTLEAEPDISRRCLSTKICDWLEWRAPNGKLQDMSCRKALVELNRRGVIVLPENDNKFSFSDTMAPCSRFAVPSLSCDLADIGDITVTPVSSRYCNDSKVWRSLLDEHHYLGSGPLCGAQIRYVVKSSQGYLGALSFSSAVWAMKDRDKYIGWSDTARRANLKSIVGNNRFLILPTVRVKNLASHILAKACGRLADDWQQKYNIRPVLVETFVDPERFRGTCYRAANWQPVGLSSGRRDGIKKEILIYPLVSNWQTTLCAEPEIGLGDSAGAESPANWAEQEFGSVQIYDNRLKQRLYTIAQDFYNKPQANIPEACGTHAGTVGTYRFMKNKKVTMDLLLTAHTEATVERIREHQVVLAPQDTSTLNYTHHSTTKGMGPINTVRDKNTGLILHDTLAFTEDGTPLGVLDAQCWARDPETIGKKEKRATTPIEQKESMKWLRSYRRVAEIQKLCPDTMLVSIGDREADIHELFAEATKDSNGPKLLVRSDKDRNRKVDQEKLWDLMAQQEIAGSLQINITHSGSTKARDAMVDISFAEVELTPPKRFGSKAQPVHAWAVYIIEPKPDESVDSPIEWLLITTVPTKSFNDARQRVEWYTKRWGIEVYHRTLKSGCRIKDRQLGDADRIETCLAIDMVVAWRIFHLTMLGRENPETPCTIFFQDQEWQALCCYTSKIPVPPAEPPTLKEAIRMVGAMGGHLGRKHDGPPGTETLWRGLQRLDTATEMYTIFARKDDVTQCPDPP